MSTRSSRFSLFKLVLPLAALLFFSLSGILTAQSGDEIVYVTNTGTRYHRDGCSSLSRSRIAVSLQEAARGGYGPCTICRPPVLSVIPEAVPNSQDLYRVNTAGIRNSAAADTSRMVRAEVIGHVDGDTVRVRINNPPAGLNLVETIRLLGVDTPETVHPNREAERFGQEASEFTRANLFGRNVFLAFDWDLRDRYGRLLAYVYTEQGRCFNARLIQEGYSPAYTTFPFQFMEEFRSLEQEARRANAGLWSR